MRTIERNYRKNPHTARFLLAFHTGGTGLPADRIIDGEHRIQAVVRADDNAAEYRLAAQDDLLETVPVEVPPRDERTPAQRDFMEALIRTITELDPADGAKARTYTDGMTEHGKWTPGREGNASSWIGRMIAKRDALRATAARQPVAPVTLPQVADGRYAVEHEGTLKFFKVKNGQRGFVFLDRQASDDLYPIKSRATKSEILALIAADPHAALVRYGRELGRCGVCNRTLTDEASRAAGIGPICISR